MSFVSWLFCFSWANSFNLAGIGVLSGFVWCKFSTTMPTFDKHVQSQSWTQLVLSRNDLCEVASFYGVGLSTSVSKCEWNASIVSGLQKGILHSWVCVESPGLTGMCPSLKPVFILLVEALGKDKPITLTLTHSLQCSPGSKLINNISIFYLYVHFNTLTDTLQESEYWNHNIHKMTLRKYRKIKKPII